MLVRLVFWICIVFFKHDTAYGMRISDWSSDVCSSDLFAYAKTSGAYMAGGFNLRQGSLPAFKPEGVKDIEFGIKADWFDKRLRTNIAVFHSWQSDVQRNISTEIGRAHV